MNGPGVATQPTPGLGAKSGGESEAARAGTQDKANAATPAAMADMHGDEMTGGEWSLMVPSGVKGNHRF